MNAEETLLQAARVLSTGGSRAHARASDCDDDVIPFRAEGNIERKNRGGRRGRGVFCRGSRVSRHGL